MKIYSKSKYDFVNYEKVKLEKGTRSVGTKSLPLCDNPTINIILLY